MAKLAKPGLTEWDVSRLLSKWFMEFQSGKQTPSGSLGAIKSVAHRSLRIMAELAGYGQRGNAEAAKELHSVLASWISVFNDLCHHSPDFYRAIARKRSSWPGFLSRDADIIKRNAALMDKLLLASESDLNYSGKQWSRDTPETFAALQVYDLVKMYREKWLTHAEDTKRLRAEWKDINRRLGRKANYRPKRVKTNVDKRTEEQFRLFNEAHKLAKELEPLNRDNYEQWFEAGWPIFRVIFGKNFENHKSFVHHWSNSTYKDRSNARALIRDAIKKKVKQAFHSIAPKRFDSHKSKPDVPESDK